MNASMSNNEISINFAHLEHNHSPLLSEGRVQILPSHLRLKDRATLQELLEKRGPSDEVRDKAKEMVSKRFGILETEVCCGMFDNTGSMCEIFSFS